MNKSFYQKYLIYLIYTFLYKDFQNRNSRSGFDAYQGPIFQNSWVVIPEVFQPLLLFFLILFYWTRADASLQLSDRNRKPILIVR